jgi:hypothetical protein
MVPLSLESIAAIFVGLDEPRVDFDCFGEICDRPNIATLGLISDAAVNVSGPVPRIDLGCLRIVGESPIFLG